MAEGGASKYLGLPECLSGSKVEMFAFVKDAVKARISGWHARYLSQGGKEILLKTVSSAMPIYAMSCFRLPKTVCANLASAMGEFWWSAVEHKKKIHWISWEKMCLPKAKGGMGFRNLECFNQALLAKQGWRILMSPECLMARVVKSKYFNHGDFLHAVLGDRPSYIWRSVLFGRELLMRGLKPVVGDGRSLSVWTDHWMEDEEGVMRPPYRKEVMFDVNLMVDKLIDRGLRRWDIGKLLEVFVPGDINSILRFPPITSRPDSWCWKGSRHGLYSVKDGYDLAYSALNAECHIEADAQPSLNYLKDGVWKLKCPSKIKVFIWKALSGAVAVDDRLVTKGIKTDGRCQVCGMEGESINHVLFTCSIARQTWAMSEIPALALGYDPSSIFANFNHLLSVAKLVSIPEVIKRSFPWVLWLLWKNRNGFLFEGKQFTASDVVVKSREEADAWFTAQGLAAVEQDAQLSYTVPPLARWIPPAPSWLKCNVGTGWDKRKQLGGGAWVLRNSFGKVLVHSRRAFYCCCSRIDAQFLCLVWAIESMISLKMSKVVFATEDKDIVDAISRPKAWPAFGFKVVEIKRLLISLGEYNFLVELKEANRGASLIAQSVSMQDRVQSYVATNHPGWLSQLFDEESAPLS